MAFIRKFIINIFLPLLFGVSLAFALTGFMVRPEKVDLAVENRVSGFLDAGNRPLARIIFKKNILAGPEPSEDVEGEKAGLSALPYPSRKVAPRSLDKKAIEARESDLPPERGDGLGDVPEAWKVMGIFNGEQPLLMIRRGDETLSVRPGDEVNGWTLDKITLEEAVWLRGKKEKIISFSDAPVRPIAPSGEKESWKYRSRVDKTTY